MSVTYWASSYCVTSPCYLKFLSIYLNEAEYSVVHFNNGCHSHSTSVEGWERRLRAAFRLIKLKQPKARIVWTTTTPNKDAANNARTVRLNEIAAKVVAEFGNITVDDLFSLMNPLDRTLYWSDNFHFKAEAVGMQVEQVADACLKSMEGFVGADPAKCHTVFTFEGNVPRCWSPVTFVGGWRESEVFSG